MMAGRVHGAAPGPARSDREAILDGQDLVAAEVLVCGAVSTCYWHEQLLEVCLRRSEAVKGRWQSLKVEERFKKEGAT